MKRLLSYSVVMFVITIILLLIIPLPAGLVDVAIIKAGRFLTGPLCTRIISPDALALDGLF